jgi:hypothetical protein
MANVLKPADVEKQDFWDGSWIDMVGWEQLVKSAWENQVNDSIIVKLEQCIRIAFCKPLVHRDMIA